MAITQRVTTGLWRDDRAVEAARFHCESFANSHLGAAARYGYVGTENHHGPAGSAYEVT